MRGLTSAAIVEAQTKGPLSPAAPSIVLLLHPTGPGQCMVTYVYSVYYFLPFIYTLYYPTPFARKCFAYTKMLHIYSVCCVCMYIYIYTIHTVYYIYGWSLLVHGGVLTVEVGTSSGHCMWCGQAWPSAGRCCCSNTVALTGLAEGPLVTQVWCCKLLPCSSVLSGPQVYEPVLQAGVEGICGTHWCQCLSPQMTHCCKLLQSNARALWLMARIIFFLHVASCCMAVAVWGDVCQHSSRGGAADVLYCCTAGRGPQTAVKLTV